MFRVDTDKQKNRLTIAFEGGVGVDEAKICAEETRSALAELRPRFALLTDLTNLESMDVGCAPYIEETMDLCKRKGISKVVRVIPDPSKDIGLSIMSVFHYGRGVPIVTCESLNEAMEVLDQA